MYRDTFNGCKITVSLKLFKPCKITPPQNLQYILYSVDRSVPAYPSINQRSVYLQEVGMLVEV